MSDAFYNSVSLLLHMDGANGSTTFIDTSPTPKTVTAFGNAQISTAQSKFGGASTYFDGSGDYLRVSPDIEFLNNQFTIEFWMRTSQTTQFSPIISRRPTTWGSGMWAFYVNSTASAGNLQFWAHNFSPSTAFITTTGVNVIDNQWHHVALVRGEAGAWTIYVDGVSRATATWTGTIADISGNIDIGAEPAVPRWYLGYIDELRITEGISRYTSNFAPPALPFSDSLPPIFPGDTYYNQVSLLLHCDGTNGSTTFVDNSAVPNILTPTGNAQISTSQSKFGGSSALFDGNGDYLSSSITQAIGLSDFTVEAWIRVASFASDGEIFCIGNISNTAQFDLVFEYKTNGALRGSIQNGSGTAQVDMTTSASLIALNTWTHVAFTASGSTAKLWIDGVERLSSTISGTRVQSRTDCRVGHLATAVTRFFNGHIDDLRVTKGVARYTSNFPVPTRAFYDNLPSSPGDVYYNNVSLLLNMQGANASTTFIDNSPTPKTIVANGNIQISTAQSKFGGASAYFDGSGDFLQIANNQDFNMGSGDFTIEFWYYLPSLPSAYKRIFSVCNTTISDGNTEGLIVEVSNTNQMSAGFFYGTSFGVITDPAVVATSAWIHWVLVRSGTSIFLYKDGVSVGTASVGTNSVNFNSAFNCFIGRWPGSTARDILGYIDDLRITKGVARYTANFTPPTSEFPNYAGRVIGYVVDESINGMTTTLRAYDRSSGALVGNTVSNQSVNINSDEGDSNYNNVSLLLHMNGTNGSTTFTDNSPTPKTVTRFGDAQISTLQSKFGGSSGLFDGTGDYLTIPSSSDFAFGTGDFTIECWLRSITLTTAYIFQFGNWGVYVSSDGRVYLWDGSVNAIISTTGVVTSNTWYHIALTRSGSLVLLFVNGIQRGTVTRSTNFGDQGISIAATNTGTFPLNGHIDDLRITKGVARYTVDFDPPTTQFSTNQQLKLTSGGYLLPVSTLNEVSVVCADDVANPYRNDLVKRVFPQ
jgi:hypothetical protein